jgi:hypothetical protein
MWALLRLPRFRGATYADDHDNRFHIAKSVFQVHGVDAAGEMVSLPIAFVVLLIRAWPSSQTGGRSLSRLVSKFPPKFAIYARIRILCSSTYFVVGTDNSHDCLSKPSMKLVRLIFSPAEMKERRPALPVD